MDKSPWSNFLATIFNLGFGAAVIVGFYKFVDTHPPDFVQEDMKKRGITYEQWKLEKRTTTIEEAIQLPAKPIFETVVIEESQLPPPSVDHVYYDPLAEQDNEPPVRRTKKPEVFYQNGKVTITKLGDDEYKITDGKRSKIIDRFSAFLYKELDDD